mmetsp:Transcript_30989/g.67081  ORF Transcript_30989/g.67081 Transcript_30989/m.67081 type:complete len:94 (+) Transcript_30989:640-921(+)
MWLGRRKFLIAIVMPPGRTTNGRRGKENSSVERTQSSDGDGRRTWKPGVICNRRGRCEAAARGRSCTKNILPVPINNKKGPGAFFYLISLLHG